VGKAAPNTTTIAFNAPEREKQILKESAEGMGFGGYGDVVRFGYLEWMKVAFPEVAGRIEQVREIQKRAVAGRVENGVKKRIGNISKAHKANTIGGAGIKNAGGDAAKSSTKSAHKYFRDSKRRKPGSV
jgi:hypothetical protein